MKRIFALALALAVTTLWVLCGSHVWRGVSHTGASLLWLGSTNVLSKGHFAILCLTNPTSVDVILIPDRIEWLASGTWTNAPLTGSGQGQLLNWIGFRNDSLRPGAGFVFLVPPPYTNTLWRVCFQCQERDPVDDTVAEFENNLTDSNAAVHQTRIFSGRAYDAISPEISQ
jgi:hypothetical protein